MTKEQVMAQLEEFGNESTKKTFLRHGAKEPFYGVKVGDLKKIVKKVKKNHELSLELYNTGNSDAMYLAGLIADENKISKKQLQEWAEKAYWYMISEYTVAWIAAESPFGWELAMEWINSDSERLASAGWATLSSIVSIKPDEELDISKIKEFLEEIRNNVHEAQNRVRYTMNGFVIAVGGYIPELTDLAVSVAQDIGKVSVNVGDTACKVPLAAPYIQKMIDRGTLGKKRKMARC